MGTYKQNSLRPIQVNAINKSKKKKTYFDFDLFTFFQIFCFSVILNLKKKNFFDKSRCGKKRKRIIVVSECDLAKGPPLK